MFKNYLKTAFRSLIKRNGLAFINIFGLSVGIACFFLCLLFAVNEFSFERFHKNARNIYRIYSWHEAFGGNPAIGVTMNPMPLGPALKEEFPDVENYVRYQDLWPQSFIRTAGSVIKEQISFADPSFFSVFSFKLISGNPTTALNDIHGIILVEDMAKKLFGSTDPMNQILEIRVEDRYEPFTVRGIVENIPANSTIQFKILCNFNYLSTIPAGMMSVNNWDRAGYLTYVQLRPGSSLPFEKNRLAAFRKKYYAEEEPMIRKMGWNGTGPAIWFGFQPVLDMHMGIKLMGPGPASVSPASIWLLMFIATAVLFIACINFTTLAVGRSSGRTMEVGIRKVLGGTRQSLMAQFLTESLLLTVLSTILGIALAIILLPRFNFLAEKNLHLSFTRYPELSWMIVGLVLLVGILSGCYPALILSGCKAVEVLKTRIKLGGKNYFTKSLVTLQFVLSTGLIISTIVILKQLQYMESKNPGFNKENVVVLEAQGVPDLKRLDHLISQEIGSHPGIIGIASAESGLGDGGFWDVGRVDFINKHFSVYENFVDENYLLVLGMKLLAGRNFDPSISSDTLKGVIINERMASELGWTNERAIGQQIKGLSSPIVPVVIGVVKNFNFQALEHEIQPMLFHQFSYASAHKLFIRIRAGDPSETLTALEDSWKKYASAYPFQFSFLDEQLDNDYKSERRWASIVGWAGGISIFLGYLGLFGLTALAVLNRTKEITMRKLLGASTWMITALLSKDFLKLLLVAFTAAIPLTYWYMNKWLQDYPYRMTIQWWVFAIPVATILLLALITISFNVIKTASTNLVKSLRTDG